jgi:hypothetical protein
LAAKGPSATVILLGILESLPLQLSTPKVWGLACFVNEEYASSMNTSVSCSLPAFTNNRTRRGCVCLRSIRYALSTVMVLIGALGSMRRGGTSMKGLWCGFSLVGVHREGQSLDRGTSTGYVRS